MVRRWTRNNQGFQNKKLRSGFAHCAALETTIRCVCYARSLDADHLRPAFYLAPTDALPRHYAYHLYASRPDAQRPAFREASHYARR